MDFQILINELEKKFTTTSVDISPYFTKGDTWLYRTITNLYKKSYDANDRIVFYFKYYTHNYESHPGDLTHTLQKFISKIDISAFFVILVTSDTSTKNDLILSKKILSSDKQNFYNIDPSVDITHHIAENINCYYSPPRTVTSETSCEKLWNHLHIC